MTNVFDSANYPETEPDELIAGDSWQWKRTDLGGDYPIATYALTYSCRLEGAGATEIAITASESGSDYTVEVAAATTAAYKVGTYHWQAYITRTSDSKRVTVDSGTFEVIADRTAASTDPRTHNKIMMDALESMLQGKASKDQLSYTINGRSLARLSPKEAQDWYEVYEARHKRDLKQEAVANGKGHSGIVKVRL